jgi:hypothetical protein
MFSSAPPLMAITKVYKGSGNLLDLFGFNANDPDLTIYLILSVNRMEEFGLRGLIE